MEHCESSHRSGGGDGGAGGFGGDGGDDGGPGSVGGDGGVKGGGRFIHVAPISPWEHGADARRSCSRLQVLGLARAVNRADTFARAVWRVEKVVNLPRVADPCCHAAVIPGRDVGVALEELPHRQGQPGWGGKAGERLASISKRARGAMRALPQTLLARPHLLDGHACRGRANTRVGARIYLGGSSGVEVTATPKKLEADSAESRAAVSAATALAAASSLSVVRVTVTVDSARRLIVA